MILEVALVAIYGFILLSGCYSIAKYTDFTDTNKAMFVTGLLWLIILCVSIAFSLNCNGFCGVFSPLGVIFNSLTAITMLIYPAKAMLSTSLTNKRMILLWMPVVTIILIYGVYVYLFGNTPKVYDTIADFWNDRHNPDVIIRGALTIGAVIYLCIAVLILYQSIPFYRSYVSDHHSNTSLDNVYWLKTTLLSIVALNVMLVIQISYNTHITRVLWLLCITILWANFIERALFRGTFILPDDVRVKIEISRFFIHIRYTLINALSLNANTEQFGADSELATTMEDIDDVMVRDQLYLNSEFRLTELAQHMGNTHSTREISLSIHKIKGCTFMAYIQNYRIEHAKQLMNTNPELRIKEVAYNSGFNSVAAFTRSFGNIVGCSPSEYKRKIVE